MENYSDEQMKIVVMQFFAYMKKTAQRTRTKFFKAEERRKNAEFDYLKIYMDLEYELSEYCSDFISIEIKEILSFLTAKQQYIIISTVIYGYSESYVAKSMNITQQSVNKIKERGLNTLRKIMGVSL